MSTTAAPKASTTTASFAQRLAAAGRELLTDPDLQAGIAQVVMAIAALAVRALTSAPSAQSTSSVG